MRAIVKNGWICDAQTGNRLFSQYGKTITGVDFSELSKAPEGTEYNIMNVWDHWNVFDPQENNYYTMLRSKYLQVEETYRPPVKQSIINDERVVENGDTGDNPNDNECGISDSGVRDTVQEQHTDDTEISGDNTGEHENIGTVEGND